MTTRWRALTFFTAVASSLALWPGTGDSRLQQPAPAAQPASTPTPEDLTKQLVVMIQGKVADVDIIGAGIIFGIDQDRIYVATANHVVRQGPQTSISGMKVLLKWLPGEWTEAKLLDDFDADLDLAVIAVPGARSLIQSRRLSFDRLAGDVKRTDQVFTVGYPGGQPWFVRVTPDIVAGTTSETITFETTYLQPGSSGGALVTSTWELVGMVKQDQPPNGVAVRMDRVVERLTQWGYPNRLAKRLSTTDDSSRGARGGSSSRGDPPGERESRGPLTRDPVPLTLANRAGWPMFGRDEFHTNWNRDETVLRPPLKLLRRILVRGLGIDSLSAAEGRLFAGGTGADNRNQVVGIDVASGRTEWTYSLAGGAAMDVTPAYAGGLVFFGGQRDDNLYAVDHATGKLMWKTLGVGNLFTRHPLVRDQTLYCSTLDELMALDTRTGKVIWRYPVRSDQTSPVGLGNLLLVLGRARSRDTALLHVVGPDGSGVRSFEVPSTPIAYPIAWQRQIRAPEGARAQWLIGVSSGQHVAAFPVVGGSAMWITVVPGDTTSQPRLAYANGLVIVRLWKTTLNGQGFLYALDSDTGRTAWRFATRGEGAFGPAIANGVIYVTGWKNQRVFALDLKDGRELWSADLPAAPTADPIVAYGFLFVPVGNTIYVFGT